MSERNLDKNGEYCFDESVTGLIIGPKFDKDKLIIDGENYS